MKRFIMLLFLLGFFIIPASALEIQAPSVPEDGRTWMPENPASIGESLMEMMNKALSYLIPEMKNAMKNSIKIFCIILLVSILRIASGSATTVCDLAASSGISAVLLGNTGTMITLGMNTVQQISDYGKLLLPVMTAAVAAQGGITTSAALYTGTAIFDGVLVGAITTVLLPGIRLYLLLSIVTAVTGEKLLKRFAGFIKTCSTWLLKSLLTVFTTYLGLSGVVSGTTDAAALKATKVTISSVVPVVGSVLSDASEAVLVSTGIVKNAAGIYGIFAVLAVFLRPFLQLFANYLVLKLTGMFCTIFDNDATSSLIDSFSTAMGLLLAATGGCCIMVLVSTVCFMRSVQ